MSPKKARIAGTVLAAVCIAVIPLSGCSPAEQAPETGQAQETEQAPESAKAAETRNSASTPPSPDSTASAAPGIPQSSAVGEILTRLDDQSGIGTIDGISAGSEALSVFSSCVGPGTISVEISGLGSYTHSCSSSIDLNSSGGHFDIRRIDGELDFTVTPSADQRWSIEVREAGLMTPSASPGS